MLKIGLWLKTFFFFFKGFTLCKSAIFVDQLPGQRSGVPCSSISLSLTLHFYKVYKSSTLIQGETLQDPQWMPVTSDSTKPYYVFSYTYGAFLVAPW